jgi:hypothetical protein
MMSHHNLLPNERGRCADVVLSIGRKRITSWQELSSEFRLQAESFTPVLQKKYWTVLLSVISGFVNFGAARRRGAISLAPGLQPGDLQVGIESNRF